MKNIKRFFLLLIVFTFTLLVISCKSTVYNFAGKTFAQIEVENKEQLIGVLLIKDVAKDLEISDLPSGKFYPMFQANYNEPLPSGEYVLVYEAQDQTLYPSVKAQGVYFAGVYELSDNNLTRINEISASEVVYVRAINFGDASLMSVLCILIVFLILIVISLIVSLFKFKKQKPTPAPTLPLVKTNEQIKLEDIKDPDMMVAALVASIDYHDAVKKDVKIKSIKEIK